MIHKFYSRPNAHPFCIQGKTEKEIEDCLELYGLQGFDEIKDMTMEQFIEYKPIKLSSCTYDDLQPNH